jgi:hypothetical protein
MGGSGNDVFICPAVGGVLALIACTKSESEPVEDQGMLTSLLMFSLTLTLGQSAAPPTLTPEDIFKGRVVEKYAGQRVVFRGWLSAVRRDEKQKIYVYEVRAAYYDAAAAGRDQSPNREVVAAVTFGKDVPLLRSQFRRAQQAGVRLSIGVEATVVKHTLTWRLEEATLVDSPTTSGK